jgi:hypothetical protein
MRYNKFVQQGGTAYGGTSLLRMNKNVTLKLKHQADVYGEGSRVLSILGSRKPPNVERKKMGGDAALNDKTL